MKLREWIYQATMQVNVSSPVTTFVIEVDAVRECGRQNCCGDMARKQQLYRGLRQLHGIRWRIRELGRSIKFCIGLSSKVANNRNKSERARIDK